MVIFSYQSPQPNLLCFSLFTNKCKEFARSKRRILRSWVGLDVDGKSYVRRRTEGFKRSGNSTALITGDCIFWVPEEPWTTYASCGQHYISAMATVKPMGLKFLEPKLLKASKIQNIYYLRYSCFPVLFQPHRTETTDTTSIETNFSARRKHDW